MSSIDQRRAKLVIGNENDLHHKKELLGCLEDKKADRQMARSGSILQHPILASSNSNS
ncbi:hypothetical protein QJS10_CPB22g00906 [Acorus calamus]|uniref:Uncharacterized protein n=1 Tax=Acorus calamus TaxID=4465 RepID=A0AAV9BYX2_ACOCL|nr:hypothetical protein QJS10_CPB22g00906 [Acorus calamus]